jgi:anaerobic selenocysteine-containing dehydrogenase
VPLLKRRDFLLTSSAAVGAVMFAGCVPPQRQMEGESRVLLAEDLLSAYDNWYATTCRGCEAGCGTVIRVVDGRARKVEGNPDHPLNLGKLCARGQATVQEQYHPDRIRGPLQRDPGAQRGPAGFHSISWSDGLDALNAQLSSLLQNGRAGDVTLITPPLGAHQALLTNRFASAYGAKWLTFESVSEQPLREATRRTFGFDDVPIFDLANARTVLSLGADFLGAWISPVRFGIDYGVFRQGSYAVRDFRPRDESRPRGRLIHVDTRFSATAASADEWVWIRPGTEGQLALAIAQALGAPGLDAFTPELMENVSGIRADRIRRIAGELRDNGPSLVIGGGAAGAYTNGTDALSAILGLNLLLGNVGQPGGILPPPPPPPPLDGLPRRSKPATIADWQDLTARMRDGTEQAVLILGGANPVHGLPAALDFASALLKVPFVMSFGSFLNDTTSIADLVLPSSLPLETWGDSLPAVQGASAVLSMQQPVVEAIFNTRSAWDVLLAVADDLGEPVKGALPWPTFKDLLHDQLGSLRPPDASPAEYWRDLLQHGGQWTNASPTPNALATGPTNWNPPTNLGESAFAGDPQTFPYHLVLFPHNTLGSGEAAHLPWLQAAPDPVTSVTWQTWVEVNPTLAAQLSITEGDIVAVESPRGRIEVPVYVSPAAPPEVLAIPLGQGHTGSGRWASGRGANPMQLLEPLADAATGVLAYGSTRVSLTRTARRVPLPKLEGMAPARQLPGQEVLKVLHT